MIYELIVRPEAEAELGEAFVWYEKSNHLEKSQLKVSD